MLNKRQKALFKKRFNQFANEYQVFKINYNEFKEERNIECIANIKGYLKKGNNDFKQKETKAGTSNNEKYYILETTEIEDVSINNIIFINNKKFLITDIENILINEDLIYKIILKEA